MAPSPYTLPLFKWHCLFWFVHVLASFERAEIIKNHDGIPSKPVLCGSTSKYVSSDHFMGCGLWIYKKNNGLVFRDFIFLGWQGVPLSLSFSEDLWLWPDYCRELFPASQLGKFPGQPRNGSLLCGTELHSLLTGTVCELSCNLFLLVS